MYLSLSLTFPSNQVKGGTLLFMVDLILHFVRYAKGFSCHSCHWMLKLILKGSEISEVVLPWRTVFYSLCRMCAGDWLVYRKKFFWGLCFVFWVAWGVGDLVTQLRKGIPHSLSSIYHISSVNSGYSETLTTTSTKISFCLRPGLFTWTVSLLRCLTSCSQLQ